MFMIYKIGTPFVKWNTCIGLIFWVRTMNELVECLSRIHIAVGNIMGLHRHAPHNQSTRGKPQRRRSLILMRQGSHETKSDPNEARFRCGEFWVQMRQGSQETKSDPNEARLRCGVFWVQMRQGSDVANSESKWGKAQMWRILSPNEARLTGDEVWVLMRQGSQETKYVS